MSRGFAVFIILALISIVVSYVIPDNSGRHVASALSSYVVADEEDRLSYDDVREHIRMPVELPFTYSFDEKEFDNGFEYEFSPNVKSGYYYKPQTLKFDCSDKIWYTTDGRLPEKDKNAYLYDPEKGIRLETGVTNICVRAEKDGKMSRVYVGSYVILGTTEDAFYGYGYNLLDKYDRYIYDCLYNAMSNFETRFDVPFMNVSYQRLYRIFMCINYDNPLMFQAPLSFGSWSGNKKDVRSIKLNYDFTQAECEYYIDQTEKRAEEILKKAEGSESLIDYLIAIHDEILLNAEYDYTLEGDGAYEAFGVLDTGSGVCESYSRAYQYLCQCIGVDNILVVGMSDNEPHMWNMVRLGDDWYHADLTWDDGDSGEIDYYYFSFNDANLKTYGERTVSPELSDNSAILDMYSDSNYYPIPEARGTKYTVTNMFMN